MQNNGTVEGLVDPEGASRSRSLTPVIVVLVAEILLWGCLWGVGRWWQARNIDHEQWSNLNLYVLPGWAGIYGFVYGSFSIASQASIGLILVLAGRRRTFWVPALLVVVASRSWAVATEPLGALLLPGTWIVSPAILIWEALVLIPAILLLRRTRSEWDVTDGAGWIAMSIGGLAAFLLVPVLRGLLLTPPGSSLFTLAGQYAWVIVFACLVGMRRPPWPWGPGLPWALSMLSLGLVTLTYGYAYQRGGFLSLRPGPTFWHQLLVWYLPDLAMIYVAASWPLLLRLRPSVSRLLRVSKDAMSYSSSFEEQDGDRD